MAKFPLSGAIAGIIATFAMALAVACQGQLDPAILATRTPLSETAFIVVAETEVASAEATSTSTSTVPNRAGTQTATELPSLAITSTITPTPRVQQQPVRGPTPPRIGAPTPVSIDSGNPNDPGSSVESTATVEPDVPPPSPVPFSTPTPVGPRPTAPSNSGGFVFTFDPAATLRPEPVFYGPYAGSFVHLTNGDDAEQYPTGIEVQDFLASAVFVNPFSSEQRNSSVALWFRVERSPAIYWDRGVSFPGGERSEGMMGILESNGRWSLIHRDVVAAPHGANIDDETVQTGNVGGLKSRAGEENTLTIAAYGERGSLLINGELVADLDLSMAVNPGDVIALV